MSTFKPSIYQQAVYDNLTETDSNIIINAVAGSGKSTTIVNALKLIPHQKTVLFLAFNKAIVEELKIKIGITPNVEIKTLHSLGARTVMDSFNTKIDGSKYKAFINDAMRKEFFKPSRILDNDEIQEYKKNIISLIDLIRVNLISGPQDIQNLINKFGMQIYDNEIQIASKAIKWGIKNIGTIDFTDMIFLPNVLDLKCQQFDYVFIDECQDLNAAQRNLFLRCLKPGGRFIAVGDPRQAIYGFAGADVESFNILQNLPNTIDLPLSVCYRCASSIVTLAQSIVPDIQSRPDAPEGTVDMNASVNDVESGDMILCRLTAPLAKLCMQYLTQGVKAYIKGKDIGANMINLITRTKHTEIRNCIQALERELWKIQTKVSNQTKCSLADAMDSPAYIAMEDKIQSIEALSFGLKYTSDLIKRIEAIFSENKEGICLSTIHKSKGLESNRVFILCPEFLYFKRAMGQEWSAVQEANLVYVAWTRAKTHLGYITDFKI